MNKTPRIKYRFFSSTHYMNPETVGKKILFKATANELGWNVIFKSAVWIRNAVRSTKINVCGNLFIQFRPKIRFFFLWNWWVFAERFLFKFSADRLQCMTDCNSYPYPIYTLDSLKGSTFVYFKVKGLRSSTEKWLSLLTN